MCKLKLFIIGNGFDIAHGMNTSYEDFREYLLSQCPKTVKLNGLLPQSKQLSDGAVFYPINEVLVFIEDIISKVEGDKWSDLENTLGCLEYDEYLDDWIEYESDNPFHEVYRNQEKVHVIFDLISKIPHYFNNWIRTISLESVTQKKDFRKLINNRKDYFLTFNYTKTLEDIYECQNVCHIHGVQGSDLLFGHGNSEDYCDEYMNSYIGSEGELSELHYKLRKNTEKAIKDNQNFFSGLSKRICEIYSYGFSFSDVDLVYIAKICQKLNTKKMKWYLNDYNCEPNSEEYCRLVRTLRDCKFKGEILTFHID
ncbi:MAG: bacteriophage abortive infection AbiH family protein [Lachnospiraceae bacterium]|nr:bacteriophage abortive infection AbiH family protein [Lachnospiraceae bacterium]